jgi:hypothetical protein
MAATLLGFFNHFSIVKQKGKIKENGGG